MVAETERAEEVVKPMLQHVAGMALVTVDGASHKQQRFLEQAALEGITRDLILLERPGLLRVFGYQLQFGQGVVDRPDCVESWANP